MNTDPSAELLFDFLRVIYGMEEQLALTLPEFSGITGDSELRARIDEMARRSVDRKARLLAVFATHRVRPGLCASDTLKDMVSGPNTELTDMENSATRDFLTVGHCLRISRFGLAVCKDAVPLAREFGLNRDWELLSDFYMVQQDTVQCFETIEDRLLAGQVWVARRRRKVA